jgi:5-methylcytosine-specific restriction endonuclease McrA
MTLPIAPLDASHAAKRTLFTSVGKRQKIDGGADAAITRPKKYGLIDLQATLRKLHPGHTVVDPVDHTIPLTTSTWPNLSVRDKPTIVCGFDGTVCSTLTLSHIVRENKGIACPTCREAKKVSWTQVAPGIHVNEYGIYSALRKSYISAATETRSDFRRQNWMCAGNECLLPEGRELEEFDIDHIVPLSLGGTEDPSNLQALCPGCHRKKTDQERIGHTTNVV